MPPPMTRRTALKAAAAGAAAAAVALAPSDAEARITKTGAVSGSMTGARALVEALLAEGVSCVFGIPGAQENELWDEMKGRGLDYLLVTHEYSAACMADGAAQHRPAGRHLHRAGSRRDQRPDRHRRGAPGQRADGLYHRRRGARRQI